MLDVLVIAITVLFFAGCLAYMAGCERLLERTQGTTHLESRSGS